MKAILLYLSKVDLKNLIKHRSDDRVDETNNQRAFVFDAIPYAYGVSTRLAHLQQPTGPPPLLTEAATRRRPQAANRTKSQHRL